jgi:hypothetical protein
VAVTDGAAVDLEGRVRDVADLVSRAPEVFLAVVADADLLVALEVDLALAGADLGLVLLPVALIDLRCVCVEGRYKMGTFFYIFST